MTITYFKTPAEFRKWLEKNHDRATELLLGFYKKGAKKTGITYAEALDEALCFGWIDGVRKTVDGESYTIRFTPRKPKSIWSAVNVEHVRRLTAAGRMAEPGLRAFGERDEERMNRYSFERESCELGAEYEARFRKNRKAWEFFASQPPGYRRMATWWVVSAKKEETRLRRLDALVALSAKGERLPQIG